MKAENNPNFRDASRKAKLIIHITRLVRHFRLDYQKAVKGLEV